MFTLNCKGKLVVIDNPLVMGIINTSPDSFYKGNSKTDIDSVLKTAEKMLKEGASILDIGGQTTKPGSSEIDEALEIKRTERVIRTISENFPEIIISIDTYRSRVAEVAIDAGASIVNDVSAGNLDPQMIPTVAKYKVPFIAMHMKGTPQTMQNENEYGDLTADVLDYFSNKQDECRGAGILDVIIDPGFGFAKNIKQNFHMLKDLEVLKILNRPILVGLSRKSTIYKTLGTSSDEALNGTTVMNTMALMNGANILRVHDVKEAVEAVKLFVEYRK